MPLILIEIIKVMMRPLQSGKDVTFFQQCLIEKKKQPFDFHYFNYIQVFNIF